MALSVKAGSFNIGTGAPATTVSVTVGFQPKAILFFWSGRTGSVDATGGANCRAGRGFAVSSTSFAAMAIGDDDGLGTSATANAHRSDACILEVQDVSATTPTMLGWADVQSINATGLVLEILHTFSTDMRISYIALGGSDITGAEVGNFAAAGVAPVNQTVNTTNVPALVFFGGVRSTLASPAVAATARLAFGAAASPTQSYAHVIGSVDASATGNTSSYTKSGQCYAMFNSTTGFDLLATFISFNTAPNGFTINWAVRAQADIVYYLALAGTFQVALGDLVTQLATGNFSEVGVGFQPSLALMVSDGKAESTNGTQSTHARSSIGAATSSTERTVQAAVSRSANTTMFVSTGFSDAQIYRNIVETNDLASGGTQGEADFVSFDSDGFTLNMSDADPAQAFMWYLALAGAAAGGSGASAAGTSTASGTGAATAAGTSSGAGTSTVGGIGASVAAGTGSSTGQATASGVGDTVSPTISGAGSSAGLATASGVGASTAAAAGASAGASTVGGIGASTFAAAGNAAGIATAAAVAATGTGAGDGASAGTSTVSGVGASRAAASAASAGASAVSGTGASTAAANGASAGASTVGGIGGSRAAGTAASAGLSTVGGVGASSAVSSGTGAGASTGSGVGASRAAAAGSATGAATAAAVSATRAVAGSGTAAGAATASGTGASTVAASGTSAGTSAIAGVGSLTAASVAAAAGAAVVSGVGQSTAAATAGAAGQASVSAHGRDEAGIRPPRHILTFLPDIRTLALNAEMRELTVSVEDRSLVFYSDIRELTFPPEIRELTDASL